MKIIVKPSKVSVAFALTAFVVFAILPSCSVKKQRPKLEIERLFLQTSKPEIDFKDNGGLEEQNGQRTVSEEVSFTNPENSMLLDKDEVYANKTEKLDTSKVYRLNEVVVKVKSHFTPERDGKINIDFDIIAPVEVLDPNWRIMFSPKLIDGDSICHLDSVYLVGEGFKDKQVADYEAYNDFLSTIVDPSAYDSLFVNWKTLYKEINKVQRRNYNDYRRQYDLFKDYETWKRMKESEFLSMEALAMRHKKHMYNRYWRDAEKKTIKQQEVGKDASGIHAAYDQKYKKDYVSFLKRLFSFHWLNKVNDDLDIHSQKDSIILRSHIPGKYKDIYLRKLSLKDIHAKPFTKEDSAKIAKHHYMIDEIVLNDLNIKRKGEIFNEIVEFPYFTDKTGIRLDSVVNAENTVVFHYRQPWSVKPGMKNLKVTMDSHAQAIDGSRFVFPSSDTLTYYIASLSQLADPSLATERKKLYKWMVDKGTVYPNYKTRKISQYDHSINAKTFDKLLEAYNTYSSRPEYSVDSITLVSSLDLQGDWETNYRQSLLRGNSIADYLKNKLDVKIIVQPRGEDWNTLVKAIRARQDIPNGESIVLMLTSATYPDKTEDEIKKMYPADYKIIRDEIYPTLNRIDYSIDLSRRDIEKDTVRETFREDYAEGIKLLRNGEFMKALEILANYGDYNTALCLVCMGYLDKALTVLDRLPETAKGEYLYSIVYARKNKDDEASKHLMKACSLDPDLVKRIKLDSEVSDLANRRSLWTNLSQK